jgi:fumarylacetoacetate (FAA) hydrolase family protein
VSREVTDRLEEEAPMSEAAPGIAIGRANLPAGSCPRGIGGPTPVIVRDGLVLDASPLAATSSELLDRPDVVTCARDAALPRLGTVEAIVAESDHQRRDPGRPYLLAPTDLQVIKAVGVTFISSLLERLIEERAKGDPAIAATLRERLVATLGRSLSDVRPGSPEAADLADELRAEGLWSPYLEVAIGPHPELFTKAPVLAAVGTGAQVGVRSDSAWNNPEPEIVLAVSSDGRVVGAALGNDVNLRDFEGRSALLLGEAKDNNASCAIGPWFRLFDDGFGLEDLLGEQVTCRVNGSDGFEVEGVSDLGGISRHPLDLVEAAAGEHHQYPDGFALFLGTGYVPKVDRDEPGRGFTHRVGDRVEISCPAIGSLVNWVDTCDRIAPWTMGVRALFDNLTARGLVGEHEKG